MEKGQKEHLLISKGTEEYKDISIGREILAKKKKAKC